MRKKTNKNLMVPAGLEADQRLTFNEVSALTRMGRTKIYAMIRAGDFPQPDRYGARCSRWRAGTIVEFLANHTGSGAVAVTGRIGSPIARPRDPDKPLKLAAESCRGVDNPAAGNIIKRSVAINLAPPAPVRAIATADDGAILIRGTTVVAELDRAECAAVRELFCP